jgi:cobalt/nickel transport system permease protein
MLTGTFAIKAERNIMSQELRTHESFILNVSHRTLIIVWSFFVFSVLTLGKYDFSGVVAYAAFPLFVILIGNMPVKTILMRLALLSPFIIMIAAANPFFDRRPFLSVGEIALTAGMVSGLVIVGKSLVLITAIIILSMIVPFYKLCDALRGFRVPEVFITQLVLLYRYSFLLVEEALSLQKARNMRSFRGNGKEFFTSAKMIGSLLLRTNEKGERIYRGMLARGFNGTVHYSGYEPFRMKDMIFVAGSVVIFTGIRVFL